MRFAIEICFALALSLLIAERAIVREMGPLGLLAMLLTIIGILLGFVAAFYGALFT